jgi:hypothetical protein
MQTITCLALVGTASAFVAAPTGPATTAQSAGKVSQSQK